MAPMVLAFAALDISRSPLDLGLVVGARSLALVAFVMVGGIVADRLPRALVLQGSGVAAGAVLGFAAISMYMGFASIPLLFWLSMASGAFAGISLPAISALTPETVPSGLIRQANAVSRLAANAAILVGASGAGIVVAVFSSAAGIAVDAAVCLLTAVCFIGLRQPVNAAPASAGRHPLTELHEGWQEFTSRQWLWRVTVAFALVNAAGSGGLLVLGPIVADNTFGRSTWGFALAAQTGGMLIGGLLVMLWKPVRALRAGVALSALEAFPLLALAAHPKPMLLMVAMALSGVAIEQFGIAWDVALQDNVPADRLARIYAYDALGSYVAIPIGQVAVGPMAGGLGTSPTLLLAAGLVVVAIAGALCSRQLRELTRKPPSS
jgi:MFS family permease